MSVFSVKWSLSGSSYIITFKYIRACGWLGLYLHSCVTATRRAVSAVLPGSKYEPDTPAPWTRSRSSSLHNVHPRGTTETQRERQRVRQFIVTTFSLHASQWEGKESSSQV